MSRYTTESIRNIALVGQSGAGKTTLVEAVLHHAGAIPSAGSVSQGTTACDFDPLEKEYGHSLTSTVVSTDHAGIHVNLVDTPGLPDFIGQSLSVFPAVETVAVVVNAEAGIEPVTRRMLEWSHQRQLCRMIIVNKIDQPDTDLEQLVNDIRAEFGPECLPVNLPAEGGRSVVDCFFRPEGKADFSTVDDAHTQIVDQVVEVDEDLMALYLEQGSELSPEQLHEPFEKALREGHLVPICFVSGETGAGVKELLEVFEHLMPNPREGNPRPFLSGEGEAATPFSATPDPDLHVVAHVFKVTADPFVGKLAVFRIHQGTIGRDSQLYIGDARKPFKVGHLMKLQGKQQIEIDQGIPGDICAVAKVDEIYFDAVLHDSHDEDHLHLDPLDFPVPVFGLAIQAQNRGEEQRLGQALSRISEEDPCLLIEHNVALNETVLRGLGDLHLRFALERMQQRFNVVAVTQPPRIAYRETISRPADGHHRHKKQTGGAGQFGEVFLRVAPLARGAGFEFINAVTGGAIPSQFIPAVEKGVRQAMEGGAIAGFPLQDIAVTVYDGKFHTVDSKEIAFVTAGKKAFYDAVARAAPVVLEPMVELHVVAPADTMGAISADLSGKRGHVVGTTALPNNRLDIKAQAPMAEMSQYAGELNAMAGGQGYYTLELSHYQPVPANIQQQLTAEFHREESDD